MITRLNIVIGCFLLLTSSLSMAGQKISAGAFRVGAAKVDVTPGDKELPPPYRGILDRIYSRAIVVDNGVTKAALITLDAGGVPTELWETVSARMQKELQIPAQNVLITATHTHSVPRSRSNAYEDSVFRSAQLANKSLQPARISYGTGISYLNVQRDIIDPATHQWWEGANYAGLSDKTVAVIKFESLSGAPIAVYYNYAMHAVITGTLDLVSGDVPGAASRYIENAMNDQVVALWSEGAAGDQNPIYFQQTYDLRAIRVKEYAKRGQDISNAMPPGGEGLDRADPKVARLMQEQKDMTTSMGQLLGEEVLRVMRGTRHSEADGRLFGAAKTIVCPGRVRTNDGRGGTAGTYKEGPDVQIKVGILMLDDIAIGTVNAEVYNLIAQRLKHESPYAKTIMATLTNGFANSGYIPDDASFGHNTFEVLSSRLQPGCAETGIVNGIVSLMPRISY
jgi:hypothetical protein